MNPKTLIPFSKPYQLNFSTAEKKILRVLRSPHWSKGKYLEYFEKALELFKMVIKNNSIIKKYKKGNNIMIPFNSNFKLI